MLLTFVTLTLVVVMSTASVSDAASMRGQPSDKSIMAAIQGELTRLTRYHSDLPETTNEKPRSHTLRDANTNKKMASIGELAIGKPAPHFEVESVITGGEIATVKLSDYKGKFLVLFFYPMDFTFQCPTELLAFSDRVEEFKFNMNCEVAAISTDSVYSHLAWRMSPRKQGGLGDLQIPLFADKTLEISKKYGVLNEDEGYAFRGLFIIDVEGNLRHMTINGFEVRHSVDETLRLVQAFQFTDKHGEECPTGTETDEDPFIIKQPKQ